MKNLKSTILNPSILAEFTHWGRPSIEINDMSYFILHIEGVIDRFSVNVYPNGKTYLNVKAFERCLDEKGVSMHMFKDTLVELFNTECYDISEESNELVAV